MTQTLELEKRQPSPAALVAVTQTIELYDASHPLLLECGQALAPVHVAYETYGTLNEEGTNAILICHALSANAHAAGYHSPTDNSAGWWDGLIGPGKAFDTNHFFVVCPNILGSCYGTTGPTSVNPKTGEPYRMSFPQITVRDMVRVQKRLLDVLGVRRLVTVCGSSLGGMQVLEWAVMYPEFCASIIPISTAAQQPAWCIALNTAARMAITNDPAWCQGNYQQQPAHGLALARMIGMISYRSPQEFDQRFGRQRKNPAGEYFNFDNCFQVESYLHHQGQKLVQRFDANTYLYLTRAMDLHDVAYGRGRIEHVLAGVRARVLSIGVSTDQRYPTSLQKDIARWIPGARYAEIDSIHGHDAFLIELGKLGTAIARFLETVWRPAPR
jgi:homoserine O-acetyltransferase